MYNTLQIYSSYCKPGAHAHIDTVRRSTCSLSFETVGRNGKVEYYVSDSTPDAESAWQHFEVDEESGELMLREPLDYESRTRYRLVVGARDRGEPPRSSETAIGVLGAHTHLFDQNKSITKSKASYPFKILLVFSM